MTFQQCLILGAFALFAGILIFLIPVFWPKLRHKLLCRIIGLLLLLPAIFDAGLYGLMKAKGVTYAELQDQPVISIVQKLPAMVPPSETVNAEDLYGKAIVLYRYGCPACEAIHDQLEQIRRTDEGQAFLVSSRSDLGIWAVDTFNIHSVPSIVVLNDKGEDVFNCDLYLKTASGDHFNSRGFERAIQLVRQQEQNNSN